MRGYADTRRQQIAFAVATLVAFAVAACGGAAQALPLGADGHIARPVAIMPSKSAKMICEAEASRDISQVLGTRTAQPLRRPGLAACTRVATRTRSERWSSR